MIIDTLIKVAAKLDEAGFKNEADVVDIIIRRVAQETAQEDFNDDSLGRPIEMSNEELNELLALRDEE